MKISPLCPNCHTDEYLSTTFSPEARVGWTCVHCSNCGLEGASGITDRDILENWAAKVREVSRPAFNEVTFEGIDEYCDAKGIDKKSPLGDFNSQEVQDTIDRERKGLGGEIEPELTQKEIDRLLNVLDEESPKDEIKGKKYDTGKPRFSLIPWVSIRRILEVIEFGAKKYGFEDWKHVKNADERYLDACLRHLIAHCEGERKDPETGLSHLAHAGCCILLLLFFEDKSS